MHGKRRLIDLTLIPLCSAILITVQLVLQPIANVELVSLLVMLFSVWLRWRVIPIIYVFALIQGVIYGFHTWFIMYLYVWTILAGISWLARKNEHPVVWAIISGLFGLTFGAFCSLSYLFISGFGGMVAYWIGGIFFDLIHCASNFVLTLLLWKPLNKALGTLCRRLSI